MTQNFPATNPWGSKLKAAQETISGTLARNALYKTRQTAQHQFTVFPVGHEEEASIMDGEIVFTTAGFRNTTDSRSFAPVASSLNGFGAKAIQAFPMNKLLQIDHVMHNLRIIGVAQSTVQAEPTKHMIRSSVVTIATRGVVTVPAFRNLPLGAYVQAVPRIPMARGEDSNHTYPGVPKSKVSLMLVPVSTEWSQYDFAQTMRRNMYAFLQDPPNYKQAFAPNEDYTGMARIFAMETARRFFMYNIVMGLYGLVMHAPQNKQQALGEALNTIADSFNDRENAEDGIRRLDNIIGLTRERNEDEQLDWMSEITQTLMLPSLASVHTKYAFGFRDNRNSLVHGDAGEIVSDQRGQLLRMQKNMHTKYYAGLAEIVRNAPQIVGKVTRAAPQGGMADITLAF